MSSNKLKIVALAGGLVAGALSVPADAAEQSVNELDQRVKVLERKLEIADETAATKAKESPTFTASGKDGFGWASADKVYSLKLRGYIQGDARYFLDDDDEKLTDTFTLRRARVIIDGAVGKNFAFRIAPDFGDGTTQLQDGYIDYKASTLNNVRFGRTKVPFGLERLQSSTDTLLNETALSTALTPNYDIGVQYYGSIGTGVVDYTIGIFNGGPDGASVDSDANDDKDIAARVWLSPFKNTDNEAINGLSFGLAGTFGKQQGTEASPQLPSYRSFGQASFFSYATSTNKGLTAIADGDRTRLSPQFYYATGPVGVLGEYVISEQDVANAKVNETIKNEGWQLGLQYVLTGETPSLKGLKPATPFDLAAGTWGAFELVAQVSSLEVDGAAFDSKLADAKKSASAADQIGVGLNWHLTSNAKFALNYAQTEFDGGDAKGDRPEEKAIIARAQIAF